MTTRIHQLARAIHAHDKSRNYWGCYREARERLGRAEAAQ